MMNYSQLKHMERMLSDLSPNPDPFGFMPQTFAGMRVIESRDRPRYEMPEWLVPPTDKHDGVRWDPQFRAETNAWARSYLGTVNLLPRGTAYMLAGGVCVMHPKDMALLVNCV